MKIALAQIAPVWLDKKKTTAKILHYVSEAADKESDLVIFGEGVLPGYPFWVAFTDGAAFNSKLQKEIYAHYVKQSVDIPAGDIDELCAMAKARQIAIYLGTIERAMDRGGHSVYCSLIYISKEGKLESVHRKLTPTYEERLVWAPGDGHGLQVHDLAGFRVGGLNCWENWMPLSRTALYAQGENFHVAVWPGCLRNTTDITEFIAKESRSYVASVSGLMTPDCIPDNIPHAALIRQAIPPGIANGGSCLMDPTGTYLIEPVIDKEGIFVAELNLDLVYEERQNFDVSGHYARPDVTKLYVDRSRQNLMSDIGDNEIKLRH